MPQTEVRFFRNSATDSPVLLEWLKDLPVKARVKCIERIDRLSELGHELRRPEADFLRDGIYELRVRHVTVNYRILYFFAGKQVVVLSHGFTKRGQNTAPGD